jgi:hypothetical protein
MNINQNTAKAVISINLEDSLDWPVEAADKLALKILLDLNLLGLITEEPIPETTNIMVTALTQKMIDEGKL